MFLHLTPSFIIAVLVALTIHEFAHAWAAHKLGDPTAKYEGRLTLNPLAHIDPLGALLFLVAGFGWGKPVPVNPRHLRHPRRDTALVALAGPASNLLLAFAVVLLMAIIAHVPALDALPQFIFFFLRELLTINLVLMAFNLLPIAPLDGSKIFAAFVPYRYEDSYEQLMQYGPYILLGIIILERTIGFPLLGWWIDVITGPILRVMGALF